MMFVQVLGSFLLVFVISRVVLRWRDHSLSTRESIFWVFVFGGILVVLLVPRVSVNLAHFLGIGRGSDMIVYGSVVLLYYLVFRIYVSLENIEHKLTVLVREIALAQSEELSPVRETVPEGEREAISEASGVQS
jgi:hypothetical protein